MFEGTLTNGSLWVPVLLSYSAVVATHVFNMQNKKAAWLIPPALKTGLAQFLLLLMAPAVLVPAFYVGSFDGIAAGLITFVVLPLVMTIATTLLMITTYPFFHFAAACFSMSFGYLLAIQTWPA
ncbi:TPA: hypothetical protein RQN55_003534 [Aeromonas dhakensis]|nr:hypothetical protein [Aeromonas dhakensis]